MAQRFGVSRALEGKHIKSGIANVKNPGPGIVNSRPSECYLTVKSNRLIWMGKSRGVRGSNMLNVRDMKKVDTKPIGL